jgi:peptidoglycan hydrolase-like protein with peptidoglycan-binding domain
MSMLVAGDLLYVQEPEPEWRSLTAGSENTFVTEVPTVEVHLNLVDGKDPIANAQYSVEGVDPPLQGTTDGDGHVNLSVPVTTQRLKLTLTETGHVFNISVGGLDPIDETSGVQMRLAHLGLYNGPMDGQLSDHTRAAIAAFQAQQGAEPTGELDDKTRSALEDAHGA